MNYHKNAVIATAFFHEDTSKSKHGKQNKITLATLYFSKFLQHEKSSNIDDMRGFPDIFGKVAEFSGQR